MPLVQMFPHAPTAHKRSFWKKWKNRKCARKREQQFIAALTAPFNAAGAGRAALNLLFWVLSLFRISDLGFRIS
jgi:hypothetical protein